jgi:threonine dehydratase
MTKKRQIIEKIISSKVYDIAQVTPIDKASNLSKSLKNNIFLKREDLQPTHSFKVRGSYNKIEHLYRKKNVQHVVTASAGNHAQGVALAAKHLKIKATIFMPLTTPKIKVNSVKMLGAKVKLTGNNFDESALAAIKYCGQYNLDFIHPFDDELVIAGQGTVGLEIANQFTDNIYAVFIGSGGGGLVSGVGEYLKSIRPDIKIIAVESEDSAALHQTLNSGKRIKLKEVGLFADGTAAKQIGKKNYPIIKDVVDYSMTVNIDEICSAVKDTTYKHIIKEPT